jgi:hypothetical protein
LDKVPLGAIGPNEYSLRDASPAEPGHARHLVYSVYPDEQHAARAAELLVEAGFSPRKVYIGVTRRGELQQARMGRGRTIAAAMLVCASLSAAIGDTWITSAALGMTSSPLGPLEGMSAITVATLALLPMALPGALLGFVIGAFMWGRRGDFPAQRRPARTFVGVEVSQANIPDAQLTLTDPHDAMVAKPDEEWRALAQRELFATAA